MALLDQYVVQNVLEWSKKDPLSPLFSHSFSLLSDYIYVPAQSTYIVPEGEQREVSFVLDNPPPDGVFEFDYNVVLSTADGSAIGMRKITI